MPVSWARTRPTHVRRSRAPASRSRSSRSTARSPRVRSSRRPRSATARPPRTDGHHPRSEGQPDRDAGPDRPDREGGREQAESLGWNGNLNVQDAPVNSPAQDKKVQTQNPAKGSCDHQGAARDDQRRQVRGISTTDVSGCERGGFPSGGRPFVVAVTGGRPRRACACRSRAARPWPPAPRNRRP